MKDILANLSKDVDQDTLLKYIQGKLTEAEKHEVEKNMLGSEFTDDALEGLQQFNNKEKLALFLDQLDHDLKKKLQKKRLRRDRFRLKEQPWIYITLVIILLLVILGYVVIRMVSK